MSWVHLATSSYLGVLRSWSTALAIPGLLPQSWNPGAQLGALNYIYNANQTQTGPEICGSNLCLKVSQMSTVGASRSQKVTGESQEEPGKAGRSKKEPRGTFGPLCLSTQFQAGRDPAQGKGMGCNALAVAGWLTDGAFGPVCFQSNSRREGSRHKQKELDTVFWREG